MTMETLTAHSNEELYNNQVQLLRTFLEHGAITQAQYEQSFQCMTEKMGLEIIGLPTHGVFCCGMTGTGS